jgi:multicomponent Na+:H+ antiporter subunit C
MGTDPAIFTDGKIIPVDPLPQALIITAIVIGASITALALMMTIKIFHYYGTLDWREIFERND